MATHSSILAWSIPRMEEPSRLQFMGHKELDMTERLHLQVRKLELRLRDIYLANCQGTEAQEWRFVSVPASLTIYSTLFPYFSPVYLEMLLLI